jgi:anaerobic carbon-monoxide dehydrogenase iron sulfur subunit
MIDAAQKLKVISNRSGFYKGRKDMGTKLLTADPLKCTGCMKCETACSMKHRGMRESPLTRVQVIAGDVRAGFYMPSTCQHCENPPCAAVCPKEAIYRDQDLERVIILQELCVGCKMCVSACPTGAMGFDLNLGLAFKCDLCGGSPECVNVCEPKALDYVEPFHLSHPRMVETATKLYGVIRRQAG